MNEVRDSLTRKLGPLPVWVWALASGLLIYWYRSRHAGAAVNVPTTTSPDATAVGGPYGDPLTLQPGEAVYDPSSGRLIGNAPEQQFPSDPVGPQDPITLQPGEQVYDPNSGQLIGGTPAVTKTPQHKAKPKQKIPKLRGRGAVRAPSGSQRPKAPKGSKAVGLGHGFWEFAPIKSRTKKAQARNQPQTHAQTPTHGKSKPRGGATTQTNPLHTAGKPATQTVTRNRSNSATPNSRARSKPATGSKPAIVQHTTVGGAKVVNPTNQRVQPHPTANAPARPRPTPKPALMRPAPRRRK